MPIWKVLKNKTLLYTLAVFFVTFGLYSFNLIDDYKRSIARHNHRRMITTRDAFPNTFIPYTLLKHKTFSFDQIMNAVHLTQDTIKMPFYLVKVGESYFSKYPIFTGVMATPIYAIPILLNKIPGFTYHEHVIKVLFLGRVAASFYAAGSVTLFYLLLETISKIKKEESSRAWKFIFTAFYAFGTTTFTISSRSLWQHAPAQFLITGIVLLLFWGLKNPKAIKWCGLLLGMTVLCRPPAIFLAIIISGYVFLYYRKESLKYILYTIPTITFLLLYNYFVFGNPFSEGYQAVGDTHFTPNVIEGVIGLLISPTRGILFVSPPLLLGIAYMVDVIRNWKLKSGSFRQTATYSTLMLILLISLCVQLLVVGSWWCWWGADSFGYRMLTEFLPIMGLFAYEATKNLTQKLKILVVALMLYSGFINLNSVLFYISRCEALNNWSFECLVPGRELTDILK